MRNIGTVLSFSLVLLFLAPSAMGVLEETTTFEESHEGVDFPVGWTEFNLGGFFSPEVRMVYPAMFDGEDKDMAGNGPFSWLVFVGDSGESIDSYTLLTEELAKRGFIVIVTQPFSDETDVEATLERLTDIHDTMRQQNQTNLHIMGTAENIDVDHWGISGHGKGATAAYLAYPFWNQSSEASTRHPPRALFGLGLDMEDVEDDFQWSDVATPQPPRPNTGFFITGTVDEVAPSQETMERVQELGGIGWQWMHLLGADHYQFQDERSFFENDGDATMSQSAQIELSTDHLIPYLDTVLHGDHAKFREAFNRAQGPNTVSDGSAYVSENLDASTFVRWTSEHVSHPPTATLNATHELEINLNWTLRDGSSIQDLPAGWDVNLTCGWFNGPWSTNATVSQDGEVSCQYPMTEVAPGPQKAWLRLEVEGAPTVFTTSIIRENTPIQPLSPAPVIYVPQRGEKSLNASAAAEDPDGQLVRITAATLVGEDASHFATQIAADGLSLTVSHPYDEEWLGECFVDVTLRSDGTVIDEISTQLRVVLTSVNDPLVKDGTVPIQEMNEDGPSVVYNLNEVIQDPEGTPLEVHLDGGKNGMQGPIHYSIEGEKITLTPLENQYGATVLKLLVSDDANPPVEVEVPVVVNPVNDPVVVNESAWGNLSMLEDTPLVIQLGLLAYDVDGDVLLWTMEGSLDDVTVVIENGSAVLTPAQDAFGVYENIWLNVTDGVTSYDKSLTLTIAPVGDMPFIGIESVQPLGSSLVNMHWTVADVDGAVNTEAVITVDGMIVDVNHSCLSGGSGAYHCLSQLPLPTTGSSTVLIELEVYDEELQRSVVANIVYEPTTSNQTSDEPQNAQQDESSNLNIAILAGIGALVLLAVAVLVLIRWKMDDGAVVVPSMTETDSGLQTEEATSRGLLDRIGKMK